MTPARGPQIVVGLYYKQLSWNVLFPDAISVGFLSSNLSADWRRLNCRAGGIDNY